MGKVSLDFSTDGTDSITKAVINEVNLVISSPVKSTYLGMAVEFMKECGRLVMVCVFPSIEVHSESSKWKELMARFFCPKAIQMDRFADRGSNSLDRASFRCENRWLATQPVDLPHSVTRF